MATDAASEALTVEAVVATPPLPAERPPAVPQQREARPAPNRRRPGRPSRRLLLLLLLVPLGLGIWWFATGLSGAPASGQVSASGIVEADEVLISPEVTARLVGLPVRAGDQVRAGDVLARLDDALVQLQIRQAEPAARLQLELQADRYLLRSPIDGLVSRVPMRLGEVAVPGQSVVVVTNPRQVEITLYLREQELGQARVGQTVSLSADPFPGRAFDGRVTWISPRAEFTPRNVQTQRDRQNLVFAVKVEVDNPAGLLKPGLPVDATFLATPRTP
jgi:multidrug resistance efflux pump